MPFNLGLLSDAALEGLSPDTKDALQQQATKQFLIGSLLGGDPSMAFRSATGVPADYFARQQQVQAQQQQQQLLGARNASYERVGLPYVQGSEQEKMLAQDVADFGPDASRTYTALESNRNLPRKFNQEKYAGLASEILAGSDPAKWAEFNKNIRPQSYEPGTIVTNPFDPTKIVTQMPGGLEKGMQWGKNPQTGLPELQMMPGFTSGVAARTAAEEGVKPREVYDPTTGTYKVTSTAQAMAGGLPIKPGPGMEKTETKTAESFAEKQSMFPSSEKAFNAYREQTGYMEQSIDKAIALAKQRGTTGAVGVQAAKIPGTPAYDLQQLLLPIQSNVAFEGLRDIKADDATLGSIAVKEFEALSSMKGSVNQGQSDKQLIAALQALKERLATGRDRFANEYYQKYKDFALTPERIAPIVEQARQNPLNVPPGFQVRAMGQEQYLVGPNKFFQKIK